MIKIKEKKRKKEIITKRKKQILEYISNGYKTEDIAKEMGYSLSLIHSELNQMLKDTETIGRAHLIAWAYQNKILN